MPKVTVSFTQLKGKQLTLKQPQDFYRAADVTIGGDKAKVIGKLPAGYIFVPDTYLQIIPAYTDLYGITHGERKYDYIVFKGKDGKMYAIRGKDMVLEKSDIKYQGIKTTEQEYEAQQEAQKTTLDKIFEGFGKFANTAKWIAVGALAVWATGYIIKSTKK